MGEWEMKVVGKRKMEFAPSEESDDGWISMDEIIGMEVGDGSDNEEQGRCDDSR
jgi:hypothetical protein